MFLTKVSVIRTSTKWSVGVQSQLLRSLATQAVPQLKVENATESNAVEWANARPFSEIPGETKFSLVRSFLPGGKYFKIGFKDFIRMSREEHGDIFRMPGVFGKPDMVMTFNPEDFIQVYRNEGIWPSRRPMQTMLYYRKVHKKEVFDGAIGLIVTEGEEWGKFRSAVNPILMNPNNVRLYLPKVFNVGTEFVERIKDIRDPVTNEVPDNFIEDINRWTFESVAAVAIDKELGLIRKNRDSPEAKILFDNLKKFFRLMFDLDIKPSMWKYVATPKFNEMMTTVDTILEIVTRYVEEAKERIALERSQSGSDEEKSVFEKLLQVDEKIATTMAMDMLFAGVDTTSSIFAGQLLAIAKNPEKQEKLRQEIRRILPNKDSPLTVENMKNLPYLRACIKEGMRIYPLGGGNLRAAGQDMVLSGYQIPKGTDVLMHQEFITKEDKYYPRAEEYLPERWLRNAPDSGVCPASATASPFTFQPFGFGPRICVGKRIVELELEIALARLVRNFNIEFNYPTENAFVAYAMNTPNIPLKFKFTDLKD